MATVAVAGNTLTMMSIMRTFTVRDFPGAACEAATIEIVAGAGTAAGAVYRPVGEMVPQTAPVQVEPEMLQLTA